MIKYWVNYIISSQKYAVCRFLYIKCTILNWIRRGKEYSQSCRISGMTLGTSARSIQLIKCELIVALMFEQSCAEFLTNFGKDKKASCCSKNQHKVAIHENIYKKWLISIIFHNFFKFKKNFRGNNFSVSCYLEIIQRHDNFINILLTTQLINVFWNISSHLVQIP